jgi:CubicO group peptidase (beta-lactamase class C family)
MFSWLQPLISVAVFVLPYFLTPPSQAPNGLISQATLEYIESIRLKYDVPGISIGIIGSPHSTSDGWKNETHGFGYMNSQGRPVDGDVSPHSTISKASGWHHQTLFAIASNSKHFAAISVGLLIDNGTTLKNGQKLNYNTKIKDILPDWHMVDPYMEGHLDLLDLLCLFHRGLIIIDLTDS